MNNLKNILLAVVLGALSIPMVVHAREIAVVTICKGTVQIKATEEGAWSDVARGEMLSSGVLMLTGNDGFAIIKFLDDNSSVKVLPNSGLKITTKGTGRALSKELMLKVGSVFAKVQKGKKKKFRIETATAVATVKGTEFWMKKEKAGSALEQKIEVLKAIIKLEKEFKNMTTLLVKVRATKGDKDPSTLVALLGLRKKIDTRVKRQELKINKHFSADDDISAFLSAFRKQLYTAMHAYGAVIQGKGDTDDLLSKTDMAMQDAGTAVKKVVSVCKKRLKKYSKELQMMDDDGEIAQVGCTEGVVEMMDKISKKRINVTAGHTGTCAKAGITLAKTTPDETPEIQVDESHQDNAELGETLHIKFRNRDGKKRTLRIKIKRGE